jgi:hypothetical protein
MVKIVLKRSEVINLPRHLKASKRHLKENVQRYRQIPTPPSKPKFPLPTPCLLENLIPKRLGCLSRERCSNKESASQRSTPLALSRTLMARSPGEDGFEDGPTPALYELGLLA